MISNRLAAYLAMRRVHYGWAVLGATFLVMLATAGRDGRLRRHHRAARSRVRLVERRHFLRAGDPPRALRPDRTVRRRADQPHRRARRRRRGDDADRDRRRRHGVDAPSLAARAVLGRDRRARLRHDGAGARRDGGDALVLGPPRPRRRPADRQQRHRPARLPAFARCGFRALGLAGGVGSGRCHSRRRARLRAGAVARPAGRRRSAAVRRTRHRPGAEDQGGLRLARLRAARRFARGREEPGLLGAVCDFLRLRPQHQRPDPDPLDHLVRRLSAWRRSARRAFWR